MIIIPFKDIHDLGEPRIEVLQESPGVGCQHHRVELKMEKNKE